MENKFKANFSGPITLKDTHPVFDDHNFDERDESLDEINLVLASRKSNRGLVKSRKDNSK